MCATTIGTEELEFLALRAHFHLTVISRTDRSILVSSSYGASLSRRRTSILVYDRNYKGKGLLNSNTARLSKAQEQEATKNKMASPLSFQNYTSQSPPSQRKNHHHGQWPLFRNFTSYILAGALLVLVVRGIYIGTQESVLFLPSHHWKNNDHDFLMSSTNHASQSKQKDPAKHKSPIQTDPQENHNHTTLVRVMQDQKQSMPYKRFHEFPIAEFHKSKLKGRKLYTTAYEEATVLGASSSWFIPQKHCVPLHDRSNASCCAETVAISLDQDDHHIINTVDSLDIADLSLEKYYNRRGLRFFSTEGKQQLGLDTSVFPCLQPGTIFHIDNHGNLLEEFFTQLLPNITVPFVIITTESDADSPFRFGERLGTEKKLLKWYGQSPLLNRIPKNKHYDLAVSKLESFPLGLAKWFEQSRLLNRYLELRNNANPFSGVQMERWTNASVWKVLDDPNATSTAIDNAFYDTLFVKFGVSRYSKSWRRPLLDFLCDNVTANPRRDSISCTSSQMSNLEIYQAGSQYLFGISPKGMGWDCYRTYELLILGIIPIVPARPGGTHKQFENLPVLELDMSAIYKMSKRQMLEAMRDYIQSDAFVKADFAKGWERLFLRYRRRHILKTTGRDKDIVVDPNTGREFYQAWKYSVVQGSFARDK